MKKNASRAVGFKTASIFAITTASRLIAGLLIVKIIANVSGAEGLGQLGQFMSVLAIVSAFAGGGITTGIVKSVAENRNQVDVLARYLQTAMALALGMGFVFCLIFILSAEWLSLLLFGTDQYSFVFYALAVFQILIGFNNFSMAIINGHRDVVGYSVATACGATLGVIMMYLISRGGGVGNVMLGLLCFSTVTVIFSCSLLWFRHRDVFHVLRPKIDKGVATNLLKFSGLQLVSAATLPLAHIFIRSIAEDKYGWSVVGYWQGVNKISDAYLQFFTVFLASYFMPRLAEITSLKEFKQQVFVVLKIVLLGCALLSSAIFLIKDYVVGLLFSPSFAPMRDYFAFQLIGDVMKMGAYTLVYVAISRAMFRICVFAEIFQALLLVLLSTVCSVYFGSIGLVGGYALTYLVYFSVAMFVFMRWVQSKNNGFIAE